MKKKTTLYYAFLASVVGMSVGITGCDDDNGKVQLTSNWVNSSQFPGSPRAGAVCFKLLVNDQERVYVGTGVNTHSTSNVNGCYKDFFYCYVNDQNPDPINNFSRSIMWSSLEDVAPMPNEADPRNGAVAFALNGKGYVGTGFTGDDYKKDFWCYDPEGSWSDEKGQLYEGSWSRVADLPVENNLGYGVSFVLKDPNDGKEYAYVGTGSDGSAFYSSFCRFDGEKWSVAASCNVARENATALVANGVATSPRAAGEPEVHEYAYLIGGNDNGVVELMERFNPYSQSWEKLEVSAELNMYSRYMCASSGFVLGNSENDSECKQRLYIVAAGVNMWEYNPYTNSWKELGKPETKYESIPFCRYAAAWTLHYGQEREELALFSLGSDTRIDIPGSAGSFYSGTYVYMP